MLPIAARMAQIQPFHVMDILARARALEAQGRSIIHMEIGEPDFPTATGIVQAGIKALQENRTHYTPALGLPALRAAIAEHYASAVAIDPGRVVVTPGASGALLLVLGVLINPGDEVLMADPGYPCNRQFVRFLGGEARLVPVDASSDYQLTAALIAQAWTPRTRAVILASPSNPTGTLVSSASLAQIAAQVQDLGGALIVDEIYHGLTYEIEASSALTVSPEVFVINSFSKYYGMTGWRVGWLVAPDWAVSAIDKLAQNVFIAAGTPAQYAALAAFQPAVQAQLQQRRQQFHARRDYLLPALRALGFDFPVTPQGAFYLYADCSRFSHDSQGFCLSLLEVAGVALTPGLDFGENRPGQHLRFSYANTQENLQEGVRRLADYLAGVKKAK